jgi:hypothetical protein
VLNHQAAVSQDPVLLLGISKRAVTATLFIVALVLVVLDTLLNVAQYRLRYSIPGGLVQVFDLNRERNFTTCYASIQLAFAALLLVDAACAARLRGGPHSYRLLVLAFGFCYLSVDEYISLHERLIPVMEVIVGAALPLSAALCCAGWLGDLPINLQHRVLLAGGALRRRRFGHGCGERDNFPVWCRAPLCDDHNSRGGPRTLRGCSLHCRAA